MKKSYKIVYKALQTFLMIIWNIEWLNNYKSNFFITQQRLITTNNVGTLDCKFFLYKFLYQIFKVGMADVHRYVGVFFVLEGRHIYGRCLIEFSGEIKVFILNDFFPAD